MWLGKLIALDMTPLGWLAIKPQHKQPRSRQIRLVYVLMQSVYIYIFTHLLAVLHWDEASGTNCPGLKTFWGGWVRQRCHVSYVTRVSNWHWFTLGQGLLSLQQVKVEGGCFYIFCFFTFIHFPFSPVPLLHLLYYLFYLSSPFLWEMTKNDPQGLTFC